MYSTSRCAHAPAVKPCDFSLSSSFGVSASNSVQLRSNSVEDRSNSIDVESGVHVRARKYIAAGLCVFVRVGFVGPRPLRFNSDEIRFNFDFVMARVQSITSKYAVGVRSTSVMRFDWSSMSLCARIRLVDRVQRLGAAPLHRAHAYAYRPSG